jgi:glycine/D-amino acid oxidase-like deaminating enzyme
MRTTALLAGRYGEKRTRRIWERSRMATRDVVSVIRRLNIRCHLAERDSVYFARWTDDHRLMLGGADRSHVRGPRRVTALREGMQSVCEYFTTLYPMLADVALEYAWTGCSR